MHGLGLGYIYNKSLKSKFTVVNFNLKNLNLFRLIGGPSRFGGPRRTPSAPMRKRATGFSWALIINQLVRTFIDID